MRITRQDAAGVTVELTPEEFQHFLEVWNQFNKPPFTGRSVNHWGVGYNAWPGWGPEPFKIKPSMKSPGPTVQMVTTWEEAKQALANGYSVRRNSPIGVQELTVDASGKPQWVGGGWGPYPVAMDAFTDLTNAGFFKSESLPGFVYCDPETMVPLPSFPPLLLTPEPPSNDENTPED